jgi:hypothetical protein
VLPASDLACLNNSFPTMLVTGRKTWKVGREMSNSARNWHWKSAMTICPSSVAPSCGTTSCRESCSTRAKCHSPRTYGQWVEVFPCRHGHTMGQMPSGTLRCCPMTEYSYVADVNGNCPLRSPGTLPWNQRGDWRWLRFWNMWSNMGQLPSRHLVSLPR